jgi:TPR repeat protein
MRFILVLISIFFSLGYSATSRGFDVVPRDRVINGEARVALVIGNQNYKNISSLNNPIKDAKDMKEKLHQKGFEVIYVKDATLKVMESAIEEFARKIRNRNGVGLFYYAGHGIEIDGKNYLLPVDIEMPSRHSITFIKRKSILVDDIIDIMKKVNNKLNILILDACRNNPFGRGNGGGLASIKNDARGFYIAYATFPKGVSLDGRRGENGVFTKYLLEYIDKEGLKLEDVFKKVREEVIKDTDNRQIPWTSSSLIGDFYFTPSINGNSLCSSGEECNRIGDEYYDNRGDFKKAFPYYKRACDLNHGLGCANLAFMYLNGEGVDTDYSKALDYYLKSCNLKSGKGCYHLGYIYEEGKGVEKNSVKALKYYKKAKEHSLKNCNLNNKDECYIIGNIYKDGRVVKKDLNKALKYYSKACNLNNGAGCNNLAWMYKNGKGVEQDYNKALKYYNKACNLNDGVGCNNLGWMYEKGKGVEQDYNKAIKYYSKACNLNEGIGCSNLDLMYKNGKGVEQNYDKALQFYKKACNLGYSNGCLKIEELLNIQN